MMGVQNGKMRMLVSLGVPLILSPPCLDGISEPYHFQFQVHLHPLPIHGGAEEISHIVQHSSLREAQPRQLPPHFALLRD